MHKIGAIQALRAIAANMVVLFHSVLLYSHYDPSYAEIAATFPDIGSIGVQLFFVISGFVIALAAQHESAPKFLFARFTRIYPTYWVYLIITVGYLAIRGVYVDGPPWISSILLLPSEAKPRLSVSWSLIHEVYFYIVIAFFIAIRVKLSIALGIWGCAILVFKLTGAPATNPFVAIATHSYTFEFIAGALLALTGFSLARISTPNWLQRLGDASYSTYLSHLLILAPICKVYSNVPHIGIAGDILFVAVCVVAANAYGLISYKYIERPIMNAVRLRTNRPRRSFTKPA